ncbi:MAG: tellurite resistance TerB family protein [Alphaproteobacteria bacterium]
MAAIDHHSALIYGMVIVSAADAKMTDAELMAIGDIVRKFPIFKGFDQENLILVAQACTRVLNTNGNGLQSVLKLMHEALPERLRETAYACAVEVAAIDDRINREEARVLELIRDELRIDRLSSAAIEHSAQVRHVKA